MVGEDVQPGALPDGGTDHLSIFCMRSVEAAHVTGVSIDAGMNVASAAFDGGSQRAVAINHPRSQWTTLQSEVNPGASHYFDELYTFAEAVPGGTSADLIFCSNPVNTEYPLTDITQATSVADPFAASWTRAHQANEYYAVFGADALSDYYFIGHAGARVALGVPVVPGVHPPASLEVQGQVASAMTTAVAANPVSISWAPSSTGPAPTRYQVTIKRLVLNGDLSVSTATTAYAHTSATSFTFPAGTLHANQVYGVEVSAVITSATSGAPYMGIVSSNASAVSNIFTAQ